MMSQATVQMTLRFGCAVVSVALVIAVRLLLEPLLGVHFTFAAALLAVLATAYYGGFWPGLAAVILGAAALAYFVLPPRGSFELLSPDQQVGMLLYLLTGVGVALLAGSMRSAQRDLRAANEKLQTSFGERSKELMLTNEKLRATEALSRMILQGVTSHAIVLLDPEGRVVTWNSGAQRTLGYAEEEIIDQHFSRFYLPAEAAGNKPQQQLQLTSESGHFEEEGWRLRKDGSTFWASVTLTPIYNSGTLPIGFVTVTRDITRGKELLDRLENANRFNRATLDGLTANIAILDDSGVIIAVNKPWEKFAAANGLELGTTLTGTNYLAVCEGSTGPQSEEGPKVAAGIRAVLTQEMPQFDLVYPCHSPTEQRWFRVLVTRFPGTPRRLIVAHEDVTERRRAEAALQESEHRLRLFFEHAPAALAMFDEQMRYLAVSRRWISNFRLAGEEPLIGRSHYEVFPDLPEAMKLAHRRALAGEVVRGEGEHRVRANGPKHWLTWEVRPWNLNTGAIGGIVIFSEDITERKRIEVEQQNLIRLIELSGDFIATADIEGTLTYMNAAGRRMIGIRDEDDLSLLKYTDYVPPVWQKRYIDTVMDITKEQGHCEGELQLRHLQTGALIDVFRSNFLLYDASGKPGGYATVSRDITEQKRAQEAVRVSEEQLRLMIEGVSDHAIFMLDHGGNILTWGRGAEQVYGYSAAEIIGQPYTSLFTPEMAASEVPKQELYLAAASGMANIEGWRARRNGSRFWANGTLAALYDENRKIKGFAKIVRDMTEKRHDDELLQSVLDNTLDGIISIDDQGTIAMINRAGEKLFGYTASEAVGQNVNILVPEPYRTQHDRSLSNYVRTQEARIIGSSLEVEGLRRDGSVFPIEFSATEFRLDDKLNFVAIVRDISERRTLEAQFRQSQKMEAFGQLAGGVAHDFNNLLTVISGFSEMVLANLPADDENRAFVYEISQAGERAAALTRQLLAFSRQQVLEPTVLDLNAIVTNTATMLRRLIGEDVQFQTALRPNLAPVKIDAGQIEQVILNLAVNARDAMPHGGKLCIETSEIELDETYLKKHPGARSGRFVLLAVSDTGTGIPPDVRSRVFEPFFTTKDVGEGTGLGLAVVHGIIKQSGGLIDVYSEVGVGTTFKICLPAVLGKPAAALEHHQPAIAPRGSETILLVEDEDGVRDFAAIVLRGFGYEVLTAAEGNTAIQTMEHHPGKIDLLVTDVVMPGISGRQLAENLQAQHPGLKVLFLSGYTDDSIVRHGVLQANVAFLQKPFTPNGLAQLVRSVLDQP
jgi:PAS domain S-box-containing protein